MSVTEQRSAPALFAPGPTIAEAISPAASATIISGAAIDSTPASTLVSDSVLSAVSSSQATYAVTYVNAGTLSLTTSPAITMTAASIHASMSPTSAAAKPPPSVIDPAGDAEAPTTQVAVAATLTDLAVADPDPGATLLGLGPTTKCRYGYTPPGSLTRDTAATLPGTGGTFYTEAELATWRQRIVDGPFVRKDDHMPGSPGDWDRIVANAQAMLGRGEAAWTTSTPSDTRGTHGTLARDAAFHHLVTGDAAALVAARNYLLEQGRNPLNELYATLCITRPDGVTLDGYPHAASWLLRYAVTYDFVRHSLPAAERVQIENFIRRNAYFMAAHVDWGLDMLFPSRQRGDYRVRRADAAPISEAATWLVKRYDTNGDCRVDAADLAAEFPAHAFVRAQGTRGPRISMLSQWYNNRKSTTAAAVGAAGVLLGDANLTASAKRYVMEWLTYSVWPDGSQGEYARHGDYCIAQQGVIYSSANIQGAALLTRVLARHGDRSLLDFRTTTGLFGTAGASPAQAKSVALALGTYVDLLLGRLPWHYDEAWKDTQQPRPATALGSNVVRYMGNGTGMDDYHELGMLPVAGLLPQTQVDKLAMRDATVTALSFPGASGRSVPTGFGTWTDQFNAMPAMLLLRP